MASYISPVLPTGTSVDPRAVAFFDTFYRTSDTPTAHGQYAKLFLPDATLIMASKKAAGFDQILALRQGMWAAVAARSHAVSKIFPFGSGSNEFMLYGTVKYTSKTGQDSGKEWAAHAELVEDASGDLKLQFYQVYLDTAAPAS
ncbi:hypothetical protein SPBR_06224 [Sporothrix brasiliensis 5110]|uniref:Fungal specific transcription factor n=1 Tax=Sporothrix brasiliensis 5110 TaxID=1398154 RepID=A0A0C2JBS5_9PEZI|nr:uncharacterized protein SPBR_06224 [Sporothrix brasiliensis 5110]KIH94337.1 hypothetical protein SPBR_06224 [Sporothrix brasiliensis 5110]